MDPYVEANLRRWDELAEIHAKSEFYDLDDLRRGGSHLHALEREELGDIAGRSLLHLQCHIGTDTVSLARLGALVTGVDFSPQAVRQATALARDCGVEARFIESDIASLPRKLSEHFDVVFTSWGVLGWQPDLPAWARAAAGFVAPGGALYIAEFHPFMWMFDDHAGEGSEPRLRYPYFADGAPIGSDADGSYADRDATLVNRQQYGWAYGLGELVTELVDNGLTIEYLHEFRRCPEKVMPFLVEDTSMDDRRPWWCMPDHLPDLPLSFSLRASRRS